MSAKKAGSFAEIVAIAHKAASADHAADSMTIIGSLIDKWDIQMGDRTHHVEIVLVSRPRMIGDWFQIASSDPVRHVFTGATLEDALQSAWEKSEALS